MPIWTQEQLFEIVLNNYKAIEQAKSQGKANPEELANALVNTERMETWLDAEFRYKLDEIFKRNDELSKNI